MPNDSSGQGPERLAALMDVVFEIVGGDGHDGLKQGAPSVHWLRSLVQRMHARGVSLPDAGDAPRPEQQEKTI